MKRCFLCLFIFCCLPLVSGDATSMEDDNPPPQRAAPRSRFGTNAVAPATAAGGLPIVRLGYLVASDRTAESDAAAKLQTLVTDAQNWYRDQMDQQGYGPKTFRVETMADGVTPMVHVVSVPDTAASLRANPYANIINAAQKAGLTLWSDGEVWFVVAECHAESADGSLPDADFSLGASYGSGTSAGVAMFSSKFLAICQTGMPTNDQPYAGQIVSEIGPYKMVQDVSFASYNGTTFSSICSAARGAFTHELSHGFGLAHDYRNDANFNGNLMGNGHRGFRGAFTPARYPSDYTRLSTVAAGALNVSRYFNSTVATSTSPPVVTVTTSGSVVPVGGLLPVAFTANDTAGLAFAWLTWNGNIVGELPLSGTSVNTQFNVPYYTAGSANAFSVTVLDQWGNRQDTATSITPTASPQQAPQPFIKITPPVPLFGEAVVLDASASTDPVTPTSQLQFAWDLTGSGVFTAASGSTLTFTPAWPGNRFVRLRVTNGAKQVSVSAPFALHVHQPVTTFARIAGGTSLTWLSKLGFLYQIQRAPDLRTWTPANVTPFTGTGGTLLHQDTPAAAAFQRLQISRAGG